MKVGIIGAGIAGLSCAYELEKYGIDVEIYERNSFIGEQFDHVSALLEIIQRPTEDILNYIEEEFNIHIEPVNTINKFIHYSPTRTSTIEGNFGYFLKRGKDENSVKNQLYRHLKKSKVYLNKNVSYDELHDKYDYVIIANGDSNFTEELGCWQNWVNTHIRGATILGDFDPNALLMWINKDYCKNGYAYLTPFNEKKASVILVVTDVVEKQIDTFWHDFIYRENFDYKYKIIKEFKQEHTTGYVYPKIVGKYYFIGNAGGGIDPFLGFGQINSIIQGVMAARSIAEGKDFYELIKDVRKKILYLYEFRKAFNKGSNFHYDLIVASIGLPGIKHLLYHTNLNVIKTGGTLLRIFNNLTDKRNFKL